MSFDNFFRAESSDDGCCIFCLEDARASTSEEHIIPVALGNTRSREEGNPLILPPGIVCDRCNKRFGRTIDSYFLEHDIGQIRKIFGVPNRNGSVPPLEFRSPLPVTFGDGTTFNATKLETSSRKAMKLEELGPPSATFSFNVEIRPTHYLASAFLSKVAVEYVASALGPSRARSPNSESPPQECPAPQQEPLAALLPCRTPFAP